MESNIILILDLFGTAIFAATGAIKAVRHRMDIFGVAVLGCCVGVGGGMVRDAVIGATPVAALQHWNYLGICIAVGIAIFLSAKYWMRFKNLILFCDAVGLGVFTAIGAAKGIQYDVSFTGVLLCGACSAIGGGMIRDVLTAEIPVVLRSDFYATASLIGGIIYYSLNRLEVNWFVNFIVTAGIVTGIRLAAIHFHIQLPGARIKQEFFPD